MNMGTTSIQCAPKSVSLPPPKSRNARKSRYCAGFQSRYFRAPRKRTQSRLAGFCAGSVDGKTPFVLGNGTLVTPQNPAYVHLQAACTNPYIPNVNSLPGRPYPGLGRVLSLENGADSSYHAFQATVRHSGKGVTLRVSYSYSHSIDDASDRSDPILVDSYNLRENKASSSFDERHLATIDRKSTRLNS